MGSDCRGVALLRLKTAFRNRMATNHITDNLLRFSSFFPVAFGMRRSSATPLLSFSKMKNFREIREFRA